MLRDMFSSSVRRACGAVVVVGSVSAGAYAGGPIITHKWVELDNSMLSTGGPSGLDDGSFDGTIYRTFDLFVNLTETVTTFDSGFSQSAGPNSGIGVSGATFFQQDVLGSSVDKIPTQGTIDAFPIVEFDSWVGIGDTTGASIQLGPGFVFDTTTLFNSWFAVGGAAPAENGDVFVARFTVSSLLGFGQDESATRFLGGQLLVGTGTGVSTVIDISNAFATVGPPIPTPGAVALLGVAGLMGARRRRG